MAILQVPLNLNLNKTIDGRDINDIKKRNELFGQYDHLRIYGADFFDKIKIYGLIEDEIIPVCIKVE